MVDQSWPVEPQVTICSWVPTVALAEGSVRHRLGAAALTRVPVCVAFHFWVAVALLQVLMTSLVPVVVAPPVVSRHMPRTCTVPLVLMVQFCEAPPVQVATCTLVPGVVAPPVSSMQSLPPPVMAKAEVSGPLVTVERLMVLPLLVPAGVLLGSVYVGVWTAVPRLGLLVVVAPAWSGSVAGSVPLLPG